MSCTPARTAIRGVRCCGSRRSITTGAAASRRPRVVASNNDVSASQAFIYRYERALQGLDARAADEAWAEGRRGDWRHGGPPMHGPVMAQRELPLPPAPEAWRRPPERHFYAETQVEAPLPPPLPAPPPVHAPPPRYVERQPPPPPAPVPAPHPSVRVYALQDGHSGYRYQESEQQSERAGGWSYSEQDGHGQYRQWGDRFAGEPDRDGRADGRYVEGRRDDGHGDSWYGNGDGQRRWAQAQPRYRCPPPVPTTVQRWPQRAGAPRRRRRRRPRRRRLPDLAGQDRVVGQAPPHMCSDPALPRRRGCAGRRSHRSCRGHRPGAVAGQVHQAHQRRIAAPRAVRPGSARRRPRRRRWPPWSSCRCRRCRRDCGTPG